MKRNAKNNGLVILLIVIILCLVVGGGFVLYKLSTNTSNTNIGNQQNNNGHLNGNENTSSQWIDYLVTQNLTLTKSIWDTEKDECTYVKVDITKDNMQKMLNKLNESTITKYYYGTNPPAGTICSNNYRLEYGNKTINLETDGIMWVDDSNLSNKIDLAVDNFSGTISNEYVYQFAANFDSVINNYVTSKK